MTNNDIHSFGNILLECNGSKTQLNSTIDTTEDSIVKIEIDHSISSDIGPKDVLEQLSFCDFEGDSADIAVRGCTYHCKFIKSKAVAFALGENPKSCRNISERYAGTVCVFPKRSAPHPAVEESNNWKHQYSYKKFHKPIPFGYE